VLDGELVVPDACARSDFEEVRRRNLLQRPRMIAEAAARRPAVLIVFDLLEIDGDDLRLCRYSNDGARWTLTSKCFIGVPKGIRTPVTAVKGTLRKVDDLLLQPRFPS